MTDPQWASTFDKISAESAARVASDVNAPPALSLPLRSLAERHRLALEALRLCGLADSDDESEVTAVALKRAVLSDEAKIHWKGLSAKTARVYGDEHATRRSRIAGWTDDFRSVINLVNVVIAGTYGGTIRATNKHGTKYHLVYPWSESDSRASPPPYQVGMDDVYDI